MNPNTYSLAEAAELVGYSTRTLRRAIDAGELLAARQASGSIRISRTELAAWWRSRGGGELFGQGTRTDIAANLQQGHAREAELLEAVRRIVREELSRVTRSG